MSDSNVELMKLAGKKKYENHQAIQLALLGIREAKGAQDVAMLTVREIAKRRDEFITQDLGLMQAAIKLTQSSAQLSVMFMTLACLLQQEGEDVNY